MKKTKNCIAVIGDIHGCLKTLKDLYGKITKYDIPVYSVGDFIDRGDKSREVIDFLIGNNIKAIIGNHEAWFLEAMTMEDEVAGFKAWISAGGAPTMTSYFNDINEITLRTFREKVTASGHYDFIASLPLKYEVNNVFISHAGKVKDGSESSLYFNYREPERLEGKLQIFGHKPKDEVDYVKGWYANVDTGCVYGNKLTAVIVDTVRAEIVETISVNNKK
jgi:serine/threonine protein phosphatase 1